MTLKTRIRVFGTKEIQLKNAVGPVPTAFPSCTSATRLKFFLLLRQDSRKNKYVRCAGAPAAGMRPDWKEFGRDCQRTYGGQTRYGTRVAL